MQDRYFRYLVADAYRHYWKNDDKIVNSSLLINMKSEYTRFMNIFPVGQTLLRIESRMIKIFSGEATLGDILDCAYVLIDLSHSYINYPTIINSSILAGLCFHLAACKTTQKSQAMAAERMALCLYQRAMSYTFQSNPITALHASIHIVKYVSELTYDQSSVNQIEILKSLKQTKDAKIADHSNSVTKTIQGAIKQSLYLIDIFPLFMSPKSNLDLEIHEIFELSIIRHLFELISNQSNPVAHYDYAKVLYFAYEDAFNRFDVHQNEKQQSLQIDRFVKLKLQAMEALLISENCNYEDMVKLIAQPFINMQRDEEGWLQVNGELDFPDEAKIPVYKSFNGYEVDYEQGKVNLSFSEWSQADPRSLRLFTGYDIVQMICEGIEGGFFSLDEIDPQKKFHPLLIARYSPTNLHGTEYLKTLFMTDYLLKMFTTGSEVSGHPPYLTRKNNHLLSKLPENLRKILNVCTEDKQGRQRSHRFWITTNEIEREVIKKDHSTQVHYGKINVTVKKHLLKHSSNGELIDSEIDQKDNSNEAKFASGMTKHYDEISEYFPEFRRLKELVKMAGAIGELKRIRKHNNEEIKYYQQDLTNTSKWEKYHDEEYKRRIQELKETQKSFPASLQRAYPPEEVKWWDNNLNETNSKQIECLKKTCTNFPKFSFQINDLVITQAYEKSYRENYDQMYKQYFDDTLQQNKKNIITKHGLVTWNAHESKLVDEIKIHAAEEVKKSLEKDNLKQLILNQYNQAGATQKELYRKAYYKKCHEYRQRLGDPAYDACINAFIAGDCAPLARAQAIHQQEKLKSAYIETRTNYIAHFPKLRQLNENNLKLAIEEFISGKLERLAKALADYAVHFQKAEINKKLDKKMALEKEFQAMQFPEFPDQHLSSVSKTLRAPSLYHKESDGSETRSVYGGVVTYPKFKNLTIQHNIVSQLTTSRARDLIQRADKTWATRPSVSASSSTTFKPLTQSISWSNPLANARSNRSGLNERNKSFVAKRVATTGTAMATVKLIGIFASKVLGSIVGEVAVNSPAMPPPEIDCCVPETVNNPSRGCSF